MSRGRHPKIQQRAPGLRHISNLSRCDALRHTLACRTYGLVKLDRANRHPFNRHTEPPGWRHYLRVALRQYRDLHAGRAWNASHGKEATDAA